MIAGKSGLMVEVVEQHLLGYHYSHWFDLMEIGLKRMAWVRAEELAPHGVASVAVAPGFMRTEAILETFKVTEDNWQDAIDDPEPRRFGWAGSESPCFVGRAIAALAGDPGVMTKSGGLYGSWDLSEEYCFTDIDGARPHLWRYWQTEFPHLTTEATATGRTWKVAAAR
jgi:hypothetical protein